MRRSIVIHLVVFGSLLAAACADGTSTTSTTSTGLSTVSSSASSSAPSTAPSTTSPSTARPNVLLVLTDDMRADDLQFMPDVRALVADKGMTFDDQIDNVTLCCPARTSLLRGQYSHNTGVLTNDPANGGFETAHATKLEDSTVATALQAAGYRTGLFGKYLNGYPRTVDPSFVPPGWDTWASATKGNAYGEFDYTLNENGRQRSYGSTPADYGTDVYVRKTGEFMTAAAAEGKPFFAYLAVYAPHQPATPAPQDAQAFPGLRAPRGPSFNEADVADKPEFVRTRPPLTTKQQEQIDALYRKRAQSLQAVDRGVATLVGQLQASGQLDRTVIIFTSDNGFHLGQHRLPAGKQTAYETDIHLPLVIRGPGIAPGSRTSAITGNTDLAPTIAEFGGATITHTVDGRSLVPLLRSAPASPATGVVPPPAGWRQAYLLEHWAVTSPRPTEGDGTDEGQLEPSDPDQTEPASGSTTSASARQARASANRIPEFQGVRTGRYTYVEYVTGEREMYDLTTDPDQLVNVVATAPATVVNELEDRLIALRRCVGEVCRTAEQTPLSAAA